MRALLVALALTCACAAPSTTTPPPAPRPVAQDPGGGSLPAVPPPGSGGVGAFLPMGYQCELFTDWAGLRERGLLDRIERVPGFSGFLRAIAGSYYCELDQLDRTRTAMVFDWSGSRPTNRDVSIAEGRDFAPPDELRPDTAWVRIGKWDAVQVERGPTSRPTAIWPSDAVVVVGGHDLLEPILRGEQTGGVPHPDLLPLSLGEGVLMQAVLCGFHGKTRPFSDMFFLLSMPSPEASMDIEAGRLRLSVDADDELTLSTTLRFLQGSDGAATFAQAWREKMATWAEAVAAPMRPALRGVAVEQEGRDVRLALRLGEPRDAVGTIERIVMAITALNR